MMSREGVTSAIGIDLGAKYSCVGAYFHHRDRVEIILNEQGNRTTPSFVAFFDTECLVGEGAKNQLQRNPTNTIYDAKKLLGRRFSDPEVQEGIKSWPFKVIEGIDGLPRIVVKYKDRETEYSAEEISSMVLVQLKECAEMYLGKIVKDAVITVPAYFNDSQRLATNVAARLAGLDVLQLIEEPISAAIAYGLHMETDVTNVLIFDLGDDTFDVSLVTKNGKGKLSVKARAGDNYFGGQDIVDRMIDHFAKDFYLKRRLEITGNLKALARLRIAVKKAVNDLNSHTETAIEIDSFYQGIDFASKFTRTKFEDINRSFFSKCIETVARFLRDAKTNKEDVDAIILVGRSTKIPKLQELLQEFFNGKSLLKSIDAEQVIAYGATVLAATLGEEKTEKPNDLVLLDILPLSLGVDADGVFSVIMPRNTPIPSEKEKLFFTTRDNQESIYFNVYQGERSKAKDNIRLGKFDVAVPLAPKGKSKVNVVFRVDVDGTWSCWVKEFTTGQKMKIIIDHDKVESSEEEIEKMMNDAKQVIAYGAAVLAATLGEEKTEKPNNSPLLNSVPLSLGVDAHDGVFSVIIPRNTPIPSEKEKLFFTTRDNQDSIYFNVYQGERSKAKDNNWLGKFDVVVPLVPKGKSKVKVVFSVDADGILSCWIKEFTTGLKMKIIIDNDKVKSSEEEIEKMVNDAERYKSEDKEYKQIMSVRNVLEDYIYNVTKKMRTIGSSNKTRLHAEEIKKMENAIEVANQYLAGIPELSNVDECKGVLKHLEKICVAVISELV